ncbi:MAG: T9SS type A sorting domain-containing protein [Bacteroidetes bacterium]|nr:T9SS type A sorting domain-containing protein [Bacteroidota bacterium]
MKYLTALLLLPFFIDAQTVRISILESSGLNSAPAIHSGAFGTFKNKWYFIGGRQNGLHGFTTPSAFPTNGINDIIYITDPANNQMWSASTSTLPDNIREAITSSNMQFHLSDSTLYMVGGYGWKDAIQNFISWPTLTAIDMNGLMNAVINNQSIAPYFRQIEDSSLAICGAHLQKLDSVYYLVFGHRFDGYYDRTDTSGFHIQRYSHEIRKFQIEDDGTSLSLKNYSAIQDSANFRRRDYNLIPQIFPNGKEGFTAFSGVFRKGIDLPYLDCIDITDTGYQIRNTFNQTLSQYHSAVCALYDSSTGAMHNLFFGGMGMYYRDTTTGLTVIDSQVPFVRTISAVTRNAANQLQEYDLNISFPALLGTNAYFLPDVQAPLYKEHYINYSLLQNHQRVGYIIGGIESPELNINSTDPSLSFATARVFEVFIEKDTVSAIRPVKNEVINFICYPNPASNFVNVEFELVKASKVSIELVSTEGKVLSEIVNKNYTTGKQKLLADISGLPRGVFACVLRTQGQKIVIRLEKQ